MKEADTQKNKEHIVDKITHLENMWSCIVTGSVTGLNQASATLEMYTSLVVQDNLKCIIAKEFLLGHNTIS